MMGMYGGSSGICGGADVAGCMKNGRSGFFRSGNERAESLSP